MSNQKRCRSCRYLDHNAMSDEMYCKLKDYELIRLRWHKQRPDWCPLTKYSEADIRLRKDKTGKVKDMSDDLISRQAAIDILDDYQAMVENGEENPYAWARGQMCEIPSAQPRIIRCKDCKYYQFADSRAFGMPVKMCEWIGIEDVDDDDFCSRAERREK